MLTKWSLYIVDRELECWRDEHQLFATNKFRFYTIEFLNNKFYSFNKVVKISFDESDL